MSDNRATTNSPTTCMPLNFHIVGDAFCDLFCYLESGLPILGGDSHVTRPIETMAGGSAVNTATHLRSLVGHFANTESTSVTLHTSVNPDDDYGKLLLSHAASHGFPLINCIASDSTSATGHCVVIVTNGDRSFMTHQGCMQDFDAADLQLDTITSSGDADTHIHIAGYYNIPGFWNGRLKHVLERIRKQSTGKVKISLVPQHDATEEWNGGLRDLLPLLDFVILNELEADGITGRSQESGDNAVQHWASSFAAASADTYFVVTRGEEGAIALHRSKVIATRSAVCVQVVDPTGAGDAFAAGFLYGLYQNQPPKSTALNTNECPLEVIQQGLYWGCSVATCSVLTRGASVPSSALNVQDFLTRTAKLGK